MASNSSQHNEESTASNIAVFAPIAAPILRSVDPIQVAKFLKERERYELEIQAKQAQVPSLTTLPYSASIDRALLKSLVFMGKFDVIAPAVEKAQDLTDDHIRTYVHQLIAASNANELDPIVIENALEGFKMPMHIANADARVTHFCADFFERLESVGCGSFRDQNPKKAVRLLCHRIQPANLKREMFKRISYDINLEKNLKTFIATLTREAINCQIYSKGRTTKTQLRSQAHEKENLLVEKLLRNQTTSLTLLLLRKPRKRLCAFGKNIEKRAFDTI